MIVYRDKTFCSRKDCPVWWCERHLSHVDWDKLPKNMLVAVGDLKGLYRQCPVEVEEGEEDGK